MAVRIEGWARELLERPRRFATLATVRADGAPLQAVVWYTLHDHTILLNSAVGRQWPTNLLRDPRCSLTVEEGYEWVSVRGIAEALSDPDEAQEHIAAMAWRYQADDPRRAERMIADFRRQERISFLVRPQAITEHPDT